MFSWIKNNFLKIIQKPIYFNENETPLQKSIRLNKNAIKRYESKMDEMQIYWAKHELPCCPGCAFGSEYTYYADKIERVESWLKILEQKQKEREVLNESK